MRYILLLLTAFSCTPTRKWTRQLENMPALLNAQVGICVWDAETGRERCAYRPEKRFTPASTAKILTLAACLHTLRDSLPRLAYEVVQQQPKNAILLAGTGDPTTLHPHFEAWQPQLHFPQLLPGAERHLMALPGANQLVPYGPGWSWDDFGAYYSTEISALPVYGNAARLTYTNQHWQIHPETLDTLLRRDSGITEPQRQALGPYILIPEHPAGAEYSKTIALFGMAQTGPLLFKQAQSSAGVFFNKTGSVYTMGGLRHFWYACPTDTVLRRMMHQSDNFLAEQLLLVCAVERYGAFFPQQVRTWVTDTLLHTQEPPRWVDGSGLSRYNLVSPRYLCAALHHLWQTQDHERLLNLFPEGGREGTLQGWFGEVPVWAKSGSMGGVFCLSGYIKDKKGRMQVFSIMINGFTEGQKPVKNAVSIVLNGLY
jgi:D-alanyl-D-alanine carboxypeptidase/D-alanyl-D-alanine-endopeptidase (penicillin-binding protein 4)